MDKASFNRLSRDEKCHVLKDNGIHLGKRTFQSFEIHLYKMEAFYVEIWTRIGLSGVCWVEPIEETRVHALYLDRINLKML